MANRSTIRLDVQKTEGEKLNYVDALRGIAIIAVLMIHCGQFGTNNYSPFFQNIILHGAIGVQLFYVASAFTIFLTFSKNRNSETHTTNFFIRRFFRIAPLYYVGIIYYLYQDGFGPRYWLGDATEISSWNILSNIFFVHGFNPYWITSVVPGGWSISVEMFFYCCIPFLFSRIKNLNQSVIFFIITILLRMVLQFLFSQFPLIEHDRLWEEYLFFYLPSQLPVFACGIILYFIVYGPKSEDRVQPTVAFILSILILTQIATGTSTIFPIHIQFGMVFALLGYALSRKEFYLIVNPITIHIGKISYSMYIVHFAVIYWLNMLNLVDMLNTSNEYYSMLNYGLRLLCLVSISVAIATVFYYLIEVPSQKIGKKIINRRESTQQTTLGLA